MRTSSIVKDTEHSSRFTHWSSCLQFIWLDRKKERKRHHIHQEI